MQQAPACLSTVMLASVPQNVHSQNHKSAGKSPTVLAFNYRTRQCTSPTVTRVLVPTATQCTSATRVLATCVHLGSLLGGVYGHGHCAVYKHTKTKPEPHYASQLATQGRPWCVLCALTVNKPAHDHDYGHHGGNSFFLPQSKPQKWLLLFWVRGLCMPCWRVI